MNPLVLRFFILLFWGNKGKIECWLFFPSSDFDGIKNLKNVVFVRFVFLLYYMPYESLGLRWDLTCFFHQSTRPKSKTESKGNPAYQDLVLSLAAPEVSSPHTLREVWAGEDAVLPPHSTLLFVWLLCCMVKGYRIDNGWPPKLL